MTQSSINWIPVYLFALALFKMLFALLYSLFIEQLISIKFHKRIYRLKVRSIREL